MSFQTTLLLSTLKEPNYPSYVLCIVINRVEITCRDAMTLQKPRRVDLENIRHVVRNPDDFEE